MRTAAGRLAQSSAATRKQEQFAVKRILRKRQSHVDGEPEYETWWEGHPEAEASWEPAESFAGCPGLLAAFERGLEAPAAAARGGNRHGNADDAGWEARLAKLKQYKRKCDDCNVPRG